MQRIWGLLAAALLLSVSMSGCLAPYRAHVDPAALERSPRDWTERAGPQEGEGWLSVRSVETRYTFQPSGSGPPFPAVLQVFSIREPLRTTGQDRLLEWTREAVEDAVGREGIQLDRSKDDGGTRTLDSGVTTQWFVREGASRTSGGLFPQDATVRILGEVGHDGRSGTSVVVVAMAQVAEQRSTPIPGLGETRTEDVRTWIEMVGDPRGSVGGATSQNGFVYQLRTHG